jgi:hypothetical protein
MAKMHELLAVESSVTANYQRDLDETLKVLGRPDLFTRQVSKKSFFAEEDQKLNTTETKEITTSVKERLKWFANIADSFYDVVAQKDLTNQKAVADIVLDDGSVLLSAVPATTLLAMETRLQDWRKVLSATPTLPSGISWEWDANEGLWKNEEPVVTFQTKKTAKAVVLYEATKEHPAQVKEVFEDVPVARITKDTYNSMLTSAQKAELIGRLDNLLKAVKQARQRANNVEADKTKIGHALSKYLLGDLR